MDHLAPTAIAPFYPSSSVAGSVRVAGGIGRQKGGVPVSPADAPTTAAATLVTDFPRNAALRRGVH